MDVAITGEHEIFIQVTCRMVKVVGERTNTERNPVSSDGEPKTASKVGSRKLTLMGDPDSNWCGSVVVIRTAREPLVVWALTSSSAIHSLKKRVLVSVARAEEAAH